jgi:uncharacterized membrane protein
MTGTRTTGVQAHGWGWASSWPCFVLVVAVVVLVVRATTGPEQTTTRLKPGTPRDSPPDSEPYWVLDKRFARGDIDERDYVAPRDLPGERR